MADKKIRSSNIELLRIVAMLMIILFHVVSHCLSAQLPQSEEYFNKPILYKSLIIPQIIASFGTVGNDVFILITGYFMANRCDKGSTDFQSGDETVDAGGLCITDIGHRVHNSTFPCSWRPH